MSIGPEQVSYMRDAVFFEGDDVGRRVSRFWILLTLSAAIASTGVVADSTATVIGAMIVAPLLVPIQGIMLGSVLGDHANLARSVALVVAAAAVAIGVGWLLGLVVPNPVVAATNGQVAARVNPTLVDLLGALATGAVGSIALIRRDIADTLPGVAIAISLVPPLVVVGLTLEGGEPEQAWGAMLLFLTNVTAILAVGSVVMALYRVRPTPDGGPGGRATGRRSRLVIGVMLVAVAAPLTTSTVLLVQQRTTESAVTGITSRWAGSVGWELVDVELREGATIVRLAGPLPVPPTSALREALVEGGVDVDAVRAELVPTERIDLGATP